MDLVIKQNTNQQENGNSALLDLLYNLTKPDPSTGQAIISNATLVGRISVPSAYEDAVNFLNTRFSVEQDNGSDLQITVLNNNYYIRFADSAVEEVLKIKMGKDESEGITVAEAAATNLGTIFRNNTEIVSFDEFNYFTRPNTTVDFSNCSNLERIDITNCTVMPIFGSCRSLAYFNGPNSVQGVLVIPDGITTLPNSTFARCTGIKKVVMSDYLVSIGLNCFIDSSNIEEVYVGQRFTTADVGVFNRCSALSKVIISDLDAWLNITWGSQTAQPLFYAKHLYLNNSEITTIDYTGRTQVNDYQFTHCLGLTSVTFPSDLNSVGQQSFDGCANLVIPDLNLPNLTTLGSSAFSGTKVQTISNLGSVSTIPNECFRDTPLTSTIFPQSLTSIGDFSFYSSVRHTYSFYVSDIDNWINCTKADSFIADEDRYDLYLNNTLVNSISLTGYTTIKQGAFRAMRNAISITLPSTITTIKEYAFFNSNITINDINLPNLTILERYAFAHKKGTESATINTVSNLGAVTQISDYCFYGCSSLTSINIPNSVTSIGASAFDGCTNLTSLNIPTNIEVLGNSAFRNTGTALGITTFDSTQYSNLYKIGGSVFRGTNITDFYIGPNITSCGSFNQQGRGGETAVNTMRIGLTTIPGDCFSQINAYSQPGFTLILDEGVQVIKQKAFQYSYPSGIVEIPLTVNTIEQYSLGINRNLNSNITTPILKFKSSVPPTIAQRSLCGDMRGFNWTKILVPSGSRDAYITAFGADQGNGYSTSIVEEY